MQRVGSIRSATIAIVAMATAVIGLSAVPLGAQNGSAVGAINNKDRAQVAATYRSAIEANLTLASGWSGSASSCSAGASTNTYDAATVESINWFRRMTGLNPVTENPTQSSGAQRAALMMHAQNDLSHFPGSSWSCHTASGAATAGLSNLTLGVVGPRAVLGQIEDPGASNEALGHRRWLLFPELQTVGIGNTSRASVVQVINEFGPRQSETDWVAWPPAGFVPDATVFPRWSLSKANADFSRAAVSVTENGRSLPVRVLPVHNGYGDATLGWELTGANPSAAGDVIYRVNVSGFTVNGRSQSHAYTVTAFDASAASRFAPGHLCNGQPATIVGTAGDDILRGTAGRDVIVGLGGDDIIEGLAGHDIICGGPGNDLIRSGWGNDIVFGGVGRDTLRGARGNDLLNGGNGRDRLEGGLGADTLIGGAHLDTLVGNGGNDICWGRTTSQSISTSDARTCERGR
jgi:hypothetical protein